MFSASIVRSPVGELVLAEENGELVVCCTKEFYPNAAKKACLPALSSLLKNPKTAALRRLEVKLKRYFAGDLKALRDVARKKCGTAFQESVWRSLSKIEPGDVRSYGEIAKRLSKPGASRAVGTACGGNPFLLFVPCHRVIASDGKLGGFSAGIERKIHLLSHEGIGRCECCH